jgi:ADP-ribosylglycohydrolase
MNKIATLAGCAIGDALGVPFEMKSASSPALQAWDGLFKDGATFHRNSKAGNYSDDTFMSICLSLSLVQCKGFDPENVAEQYLAWYNSGETRGIGSTTAGSLMHLKMGADWRTCGATHTEDGRPAAGNGTAMRVSPIGLYFRKEPLKVMEHAMTDASITHNSFEAKMGSVAVALGTSFLANGTHDRVSVIEEIRDAIIDSDVKNKLIMATDHLQMQTSPLDALADIGTSGYVAETVGAAFYCLAATDNFKDSVVLAVKAGGDCDTIGAITGALAGTLYGLDLIPKEYRSVEDFQLLQDLTDELLK